MIIIINIILIIIIVIIIVIIFIIYITIIIIVSIIIVITIYFIIMIIIIIIIIINIFVIIIIIIIIISSSLSLELETYSDFITFINTHRIHKNADRLLVVVFCFFEVTNNYVVLYIVMVISSDGSPMDSCDFYTHLSRLFHGHLGIIVPVPVKGRIQHKTPPPPPPFSTKR